MKCHNIVTLEWFCDVLSKSLCLVGDVSVSGTENGKLKFSKQTHLDEFVTHVKSFI